MLGAVNKAARWVINHCLENGIGLSVVNEVKLDITPLIGTVGIDDRDRPSDRLPQNSDMGMILSKGRALNIHYREEVIIDCSDYDGVCWHLN